MNNIHILHLIAACIIDPLRINHSCSPNVVWSWVAASGGYEVKEVRAVRRVEAGEELCANYIDSFQVGASAWTLSQCNCLRSRPVDPDVVCPSVRPLVSQ